MEKKVRLGVGSRNKYTYSPDSLDEGEERVEKKGSKEGRSVCVCVCARDMLCPMLNVGQCSWHRGGSVQIVCIRLALRRQYWIVRALVCVCRAIECVPGKGGRWYCERSSLYD